MLKVRVALISMALVVSGTGLAACGGDDRWCERDATDTKVADRFCEQNTPGYEWEPDSDKKHKKTKSKKTKKRT